MPPEPTPGREAPPLQPYLRRDDQAAEGRGGEERAQIPEAEFSRRFPLSLSDFCGCLPKELRSGKLDAPDRTSLV